MKKIVLISILFAPVLAFANGTYTSSDADATAKANASSTAVGVGVGVGVGYGGKAAANSNAYGGVASAVSGPSSAVTGGSGASASNGNVTFNGEKYPNQAPVVVTTSSPSFSQRNCTPVGSVNASGPFGGLGVAFPMGGQTCDGLNVSDKTDAWAAQYNDLELWRVSCELLVVSNDDLAEAFENANYSCKAAYEKQVARVVADKKMRSLIESKN